MSGDDQLQPRPSSQNAPTIREHGLVARRKACLTTIANPVDEIDEGHQARECTPMVIFYLIQRRGPGTEVVL